MTSQCMIFNKRTIIFASDKQETMPDGKTYGGIEKIFELSNLHSAGIMVNGDADFEKVPIETLIGEFKIQTNFRQFSTIEEIKKEFIKFLSLNTEYSSCHEFLKETLVSFKDNILEDFKVYGFENAIKNKPRKELPYFVLEFQNVDNEFHDIIPDGVDKDKFNKILWEIFSHDLQYVGIGIIFAGFNIKSHFPSFIEINMYCNDNGRIIYQLLDSAIDCQEPFIKVFAINEEAYTFITGVNLEFIDYILNYIANANESIISNLKWNLEKEKIENMDKIVGIVKKLHNNEFEDLSEDIMIFRLNAIEDTSYSIENLPDRLLCIFAELLIRLTAIKQKTTSEIESVSISSDILIMSKINDFKWVKNEERIF